MYYLYQMSIAIRRAAVLLLVALFGVSILGAATLEGRWRLVEQHVGDGKANLASADTPLRLEFYLSGASLAGRIWTAEKKPRATPWPSFLSDGTLVPIRSAQVVFSVAGDAARASYRVPSRVRGDPDLEVEEEYRLVEEGRALLGTVRITSLEDGKPAGSYLLHRRFEKEP